LDALEGKAVREGTLNRQNWGSWAPKKTPQGQKKEKQSTVQTSGKTTQGKRRGEMWTPEKKRGEKEELPFSLSRKER